MNKVQQTINKLLSPVILWAGVCAALWCIIGRFELPVHKWWYAFLLFVLTFVIYIFYTRFKGKWNLLIPAVFLITGFLCRNIMIKGFLLAAGKFFGGYTALADIDTRFGNVFCTTFFFLLIGALLLSIISFSFYENRSFFLYLFCTLPFVFIPMLMEKVGTYRGLVTYGITLVVVFVTGKGRGKAGKDLRQRVMPVILSMALLSATISLLMCGRVKYQNMATKIQEVKDVVKYVAYWDMPDIVTWSKCYFTKMGEGYGKVGDVDTVEQTGEKILEVRTDFLAMEDLYLKEFVADTFDKNQWHMSNKFSGSNREIWESLERSFLIMTEQELYNEGRLTSGSTTTYSAVKISDVCHVKNIGLGKGNRLTTYYPKKGFTYEKDGRMSPDRSVEYDIDYYWGLQTRAKALTSVEGDEGGYENTIFSKSDYYEKAQEGYLDVPFEKNVFVDYEAWESQFLDNQKVRGFTSYKMLIQCVTSYLEHGFFYTLSPGKTPEGENAIRYFLMENRKGYCTHFASAAVMIFRHIGIPARYVEGYRVDAERMKETLWGESKEKEVKYSADVTDKDAHAWVEIYIKPIGWMPVEATPASEESQGSSVAANAFVGFMKHSLTPSGLEKKEEPKETPSVPKTPEPSVKPTSSPEAQPVSRAGIKTDGRKITRGQCVTVCILLLLVCIVLLRIFLWPIWYEKSLKKKTPAKRVLSRYSSMRFFLWRHGGLYQGESLEEYGEKLGQAFSCDRKISDALASHFLRADFGEGVYLEEDYKEFEMLLSTIKGKG